MMNITKKLASVAVAGLALAATIAFAPAANAATPAEVVSSPMVGVADDGSFYYIPGEWSGDVTTLTVGWYSCPSAQLGAIGATADLLQQLTDAGCTFVSNDKTLSANTFDNVNSFAVIIETADDTTSAFMGNNLIMYDKNLGPIAYSAGVGALTQVRSLYFAGNSATLNAAARASLYTLISKIGMNNDVTITIDAYAAKGGSSTKNLALAAARARQIKFFFKHYGITSSFKIRTHIAKHSGAAGRKATVKVAIGMVIAPPMI